MPIHFFLSPIFAEILKGEVKFHHNKHLCYVQTIDWTDMRPDIKQDYLSDNETVADCDGKECYIVGLRLA